MAKFDITYRCGHTGTEDIQGPQKDRARKAEYAATKLCPACFTTQQEATRRETQEAAKSANAADGLAALTGSEKQIAWAETLRADRLAAMEAMLATYTQAPAELVAAIRTWARQQTAATWWIDHRDLSIANFVREAIVAVRAAQ